MKINLLDCTLRDGGYLNDWEFGRNDILNIYRTLVNANIEAFDVGFLDDRRPFDENRAIYPNTESICEFYKNEPKGDVLITAMTTGLLHDGHCSINSIGKHSDNDFIDGIRVPFKKHKIDEAIEYCYMLKEKGYKVFVNPTSVTTYSEAEMLNLIEKVNRLEPYSMAIVDTYGLLYKENLYKYFSLLDNNLKKNISIAHHAHNNYQLAFSNSAELTKIKTDRNIFIDSSLYGMAKSAGNCNTELISRYLNEFCGKNYDIMKILDITNKYIIKYLKTCNWGYNISFYIASINNRHPNYVKFLEKKGITDVNELSEILSLINQEYALEYSENHINEIFEMWQHK